jgi:hypothetical protein
VPAARRALHCEIEGLPVDVDRTELSSAGVYVLTPQPLPIDSEVSVFLRIEEQRFEMTGHVVTCVSCEQAARAGKNPGYALLFTNLSDADRKRMASAISALRAASGPPTSPKQPVVVAKPVTSRAAPLHSPAELALLAQLRAELVQLADKTAWAILGVSQGADHATVKTAFFQASKRYHPHLFARYAHPEISRTVTELFIAHKRAYASMTKTAKAGSGGRRT